MHDDSRLYAKLTLDFADSPKIAPLSDRAFREYVEALLWSTRIMTDGLIPDRMIQKLFSFEALDELTSNDLNNPSLIMVEGGYQIHDFEKHQNTRDKIQKKRDAGRLGGLAKARNSAESSDSVAGARDSLQQKSSSPLAIQIQIPNEDTNRDSPRKRGSRLPDDFQATLEMRAWAIKNVPLVNVDIATETFKDYWRSVPGAKGVKLDWIATWRTWLRREVTFNPMTAKQLTEQQNQERLRATADDRARIKQIEAERFRHEIQQMRDNATEPPKCDDHGISLVQCLPCIAKLNESGS
jgi:hypothetical protein